MSSTETSTLSREQEDLLEALAWHRGFLRHTVQGLTDEQARQAPTASELCLGGLVKHMTAVERNWTRFVRTGELHGATEEELNSEEFAAERTREFRLLEDETLAEVLDAYTIAAAETDEVVRTADLDADHELPAAPWWPHGSRWSNRRAFTQILAEITQHSGHADIIRETIDGQRTMG